MHPADSYANKIERSASTDSPHDSSYIITILFRWKAKSALQIICTDCIRSLMVRTTLDPLATAETLVTGATCGNSPDRATV